MTNAPRCLQNKSTPNDQTSLDPYFDTFEFTISYSHLNIYCSQKSQIIRLLGYLNTERNGVMKSKLG